MNHLWIEDYCLAKRGANKEFKEEWQAIRYMVGNKMFALQGCDNKGNAILTLKLLPAEGAYLRSQYKDILPGYYMNKEHWNSIYLDGAVPKDVIQTLLDQSYSILFSSLTKKAQKEILQSSLGSL